MNQDLDIRYTYILSNLPPVILEFVKYLEINMAVTSLATSKCEH